MGIGVTVGCAVGMGVAVEAGTGVGADVAAGVGEGVGARDARRRAGRAGQYDGGGRPAGHIGRAGSTEPGGDRRRMSGWGDEGGLNPNRGIGLIRRKPAEGRQPVARGVGEHQQ